MQSTKPGEWVDAGAGLAGIAAICCAPGRGI